MTPRRLTLARRRLGGHGIAIAALGALPGCSVDSMMGPRKDPAAEIIAAPVLRSDTPVQVAKDYGMVLGASQGLATTPRLEAACNATLDRLKAALPGSVIPARVRVLSDSAPGAFAYPSNIFLTQGMLQAVQNEDQLAFILGHELGHITLGHHDSGILDLAAWYMLAAAETAYELRPLIDTGAAVAGGGKLPNFLWGSYAATMVCRDVVSPAWMRSQETEADRFGARLMVAAGYNIDQASEVMDLLKQSEEQFAMNSKVDLTALEKVLAPDAAKAQSEAESERMPVDLQGLMRKALATIVSGGGQALREIRRSHPTAAERTKELRLFVETAMADAPEQPVRTRQWQAVLAEPQTRTALRRYEQLRRANTLANDGKLPQAQGVVSEVAAAMAADSRVSMLRCDLAMQRGDNRLAVEAAGAGLRTELPSVRLFSVSAQMLVDQRQTDEALRRLSRAAELYESPPTVLADRITILRRAGRNPEATAALAECILRWPQKSGVCRAAMNNLSMA